MNLIRDIRNRESIEHKKRHVVIRRNFQEGDDETKKNFYYYYRFFIFPFLVLGITLLLFYFLAPLSQGLIEKIFPKPENNNLDLSLVKTVEIIKDPKSQNTKTLTDKLKKRSYYWFLGEQEKNIDAKGIKLIYKGNKKDAEKFLSVMDLSKELVGLEQSYSSRADYTLFFGKVAKGER